MCEGLSDGVAETIDRAVVSLIQLPTLLPFSVTLQVVRLIPAFSSKEVSTFSKFSGVFKMAGASSTAFSVELVLLLSTIKVDSNVNTAEPVV